jgi:hypothetical protein
VQPLHPRFARQRDVQNDQIEVLLGHQRFGFFHAARSRHMGAATGERALDEAAHAFFVVHHQDGKKLPMGEIVGRGGIGHCSCPSADAANAARIIVDTDTVRK